MTARRLEVGRRVFDRDRQAHGDVVGLYPSPLVVRLKDADGFVGVFVDAVRACMTLAGVAPRRDCCSAFSRAQFRRWVASLCPIPRRVG